MELIPYDHQIPVLYSMEEEDDPLCQLKLFTPDANWTWYIIEIDDANALGHDGRIGDSGLGVQKRERTQTHAP